MSPRLGLLAAALVAPALPMLVSSPAFAAGTICVGPVPAGTACTTAAPTIQSAITASVAGDTIRVGQGTYVDGPYTLKPSTNLKGNGAGTSGSATVIATVTTNPPSPTSQTFISAPQSNVVSDLRVQMTNGNGATGIVASNFSTVDNVVVFGAGSTSSVGIAATGNATLRDGTVNMTGSSGGTGVRSTGGNVLISQSTWNGGGSGYVLAGATDNATDTVQRITVNGEGDAVRVQRGVLNIDDSVLDLGTIGTTGLLARPDDGASATIRAINVTVVRGAAGSRGVVADASGSGNRTAAVTMTNSIVNGPTTPLQRISGAGTASLNVAFSNVPSIPANVTNGGSNQVGVDPRFLNYLGADYHLRGDSPLVDKGSASPFAKDLDGKNRSVDGDRNGVPTPDLGAYELTDFTAPTTTFTAGPSGPTNNRQPVFQFRSGAEAKFECSLDGGAFQACTSPATTPLLADGAHQFSVRAYDEAFNIENPPVTRVFVVDTIAPVVTITKKPAKRFFKKRVKFKFAVNDPSATLQCNLDDRGFKPCNFKWKFNTKVGKHKVQVRAVDAAGNTGPTVKYGYKRLGTKKGR